MSVDAVSAGAVPDLVGGAAGSDVGFPLLASAGVGLELPESADVDVALSASVSDFEAVMVAAAGLCADVIVEVTANSLAPEDSPQTSGGPNEALVEGDDKSDGGNSLIDLGLAPLHPDLVELIQSATPSQISEICSNLQSGLGLQLGASVADVGDGVASGNCSDFEPASRISGEVSPRLASVGGGSAQALASDVTNSLVSRVVGRESEVVSQLSKEFVDAALAELPLRPSPELTSDVHSLTRKRSDTVALSSRLVQESPIQAIADLSLFSRWQEGSETGILDRDSLSILRESALEGRTLGVGKVDVEVGETMLSVTPSTFDVRREATSPASTVLNSFLPQAIVSQLNGTRVVAASGVESSVLLAQVAPSVSVVAEGAKEGTPLRVTDFERQVVGGGDISGSTVPGLALEGQSGREGGGGAQTGSGDGDTSGRKKAELEIAVGWHGRRVVNEALPVRGQVGSSGGSLSTSVVTELALDRRDALREDGWDGTTDMTAFTLVQRSAGFQRGVTAGEPHLSNRAPEIDRVAGEVWSKLADAVARVRADRGALKVEIELSRGMTVEVELRGGSGGVNAIFRVGDNGLRQTLESMWSTLPRSEKVSALDLSEVSFERGSSREFGDSDSREARQDAQRRQQERFDGDVREFEGKSSEKNVELGTPEATASREALHKRDIHRTNPVRQ